MTPPRARSVLLAALLTALSAQAQSNAPRRLNVHFDTPTGGVVDSDLVTQLEASVSDPSVRTALLTVNGVSYEVPVEEGHIRQNVVVVPGNNRVLVSVARGSETARDSATFFLRGPRVELVVVLGWASRGEIIDLWAREPTGETCKWDHRETQGGGRLLDFSQDAIGFGSQAYVLPTVRPGRYRIKIHYWSATSPGDDREDGFWSESVGRLDEIETGLATATGAARDELLTSRTDLTRRLDRWASPAAPQTPVHAEVVLFANTPHERRWRFDRIASRTGALETLGEVEVSAEMIRAARDAEAPR